MWKSFHNGHKYDEFGHEPSTRQAVGSWKYTSHNETLLLGRESVQTVFVSNMKWQNPRALIEQVARKENDECNLLLDVFEQRDSWKVSSGNEDIPDEGLWIFS